MVEADHSREAACFSPVLTRLCEEHGTRDPGSNVKAIPEANPVLLPPGSGPPSASTPSRVRPASQGDLYCRLRFLPPHSSTWGEVEVWRSMHTRVGGCTLAHESRSPRRRPVRTRTTIPHAESCQASAQPNITPSTIPLNITPFPIPPWTAS
jgi:hypothetical protein